jgi:hypothetical protein
MLAISSGAKVTEKARKSTKFAEKRGKFRLFSPLLTIYFRAFF